MRYLSELIILVVLILAGIIGIIGTRPLTFMEGLLPGAGFLPMVLSLILIAICLTELKRFIPKASKEDKEMDNKQVRRVSLFFVLLSIAVLIGTPLIGLLPSLGIYLLISNIVWSKLKTRSAVLNTVMTIVIIFVVFSVAMKVNMPWGILGR